MAYLMMRSDANAPWKCAAEQDYWDMPETVFEYTQCGHDVADLLVVEEPFSISELLNIRMK